MRSGRAVAFWPAVVAAALGCATPVPPNASDIPNGAIGSLEGGPVEVRAAFGLKGRRTLSLPAIDAWVDEDQYTTAVVQRMAEQLRAHGVLVESGADRVIEIQVVRVSIHPKPQFTCVIDFNRRLGGGSPRGLQSRAEHWNVQKACPAAVSQAVIDALNDPSTRSYLREGSP